jgi:hypothetical protein
MNKTEEFVENIYLELKNYVNGIFNNNGTYVSEKIKELNLNKYDEEKYRNIISASFNDVMVGLLYAFDGESSIGNAMQQSYKIYDENDNSIYSSGELEIEAYEYFTSFKYERKNKNYDFLAVLNYLKKEHCENTEGFAVKIFENIIPIEINFFDRRIIFCNELVRVGINFNSFEKTMELIKGDIEKIKKQITQDKGFELLKNNETVGEIKVMEVINEKIYE